MLVLEKLRFSLLLALSSRWVRGSKVTFLGCVFPVEVIFDIEVVLVAVVVGIMPVVVVE